MAVCDSAFEAAARNETLRQDLASMRARLEKEKARGSRQNIKWGRGGMTDVYFITRYLQLRDRVYFPPEHGTTRLIEHLGAGGHLDPASTRVLLEGYGFLRRLDHWLRLLLDRPGPDLPASQVSLREITRAMGFATIEEFERAYAEHTSAVRGVYEKVMGGG
jgi:glutamate-ammonia-ligase adenylyltransferase